MDPVVHAALTHPGNIVFPNNLPFVKNLSAAGGRVVRQASGHLVFYDSDNRRFLATDPEGNPLHECEWVTAADGTVKLGRARVRLDWGQWVGVKPEGMAACTTLDLSRKPGWERLRADDLRSVAAQAMKVSLEEVRFFYGDEDLVVDTRGQATIRHKKDALYVLEAGTFERVRFMACLGAMHWARVDFLPVVELFQSLLSGTGSAVFELIRGLYDDQNQTHPLPLRYRGIPTYPSDAAYRLFSSCFAPQLPGGGDPFPVFMDPPRSHEVTWLPISDPPRRYFDRARHLCVTLKGSTVQKVTVADDPAGLPYVLADRQGFAPGDRTVSVSQGRLVLKDGEKRVEMPLSPAWGGIGDSLASPARSYPLDWRTLFAGPPPHVAPAQAFSAVLLYPEDETEIEEAPTQPFVADYLQDTMEEESNLRAHLARSERVLIHNFDAVLTTCVNLDRPRDYTILYSRPEFAQKQAQALWNQLAKAGRVEWAKRIRLLPAESSRTAAYRQPYDLIYAWVPFPQFDRPGQVEETARAVAASLRPGGLGFVVGPQALSQSLQANRLRPLYTEPVEDLPTFRMHLSILPRARVKPGVWLFGIRKE
ncbi:MAG: hypothetical protein ACREIO_02165 [Nitrospiraceae bacterium]